jgi:hypothetical protein
MRSQTHAIQQPSESTFSVPIPLVNSFGCKTESQPIIGNGRLAMFPQHQPSLDTTELQSSNPDCSKVDFGTVSYLPPLPTTTSMPSLATQSYINVTDEDMLNMDTAVTPTEDSNWLLQYLSQASSPVCQPPQAVQVADQPLLSLNNLLASQPSSGAQENANLSTLDVLTLLARRGFLKLD